MHAFPEYIIVETDLDQFIVARLETTDSPRYRKLLEAVGRPSAELAHEALTRAHAMSQDHDSLAGYGATNVSDSRVKVNDRGEGVISGRISPEGLLADEPVEDD